MSVVERLKELENFVIGMSVNADIYNNNEKMLIKDLNEVRDSIKLVLMNLGGN